MLEVLSEVEFSLGGEEPGREFVRVGLLPRAGGCEAKGEEEDEHRCILAALFPSLAPYESNEHGAAFWAQPPITPPLSPKER